MTPRPARVLLCSGVAAIGLMLATWARWPAWLLYNASDSAPRGWYWQRPVSDPRPGMHVFARLPPAPARLAHARGYLPMHLPILKRIGAVEGQFACVEHRQVRIDGRFEATARDRDRRGRPLAAWTGCRRLARGEVFLLARDSQTSFDSRYFGPVGREAILGEAVPLWTW